MFRSQSNRNVRRSRRQARVANKTQQRRLSVEWLESRHLLTGVVHICTDAPLGPPAPAFVPACPGAVPAGQVFLMGDASNNSVELRQGAFAGEFQVSDGNRTLLYHNNALVAAPHQIFNILGQINVRLGGGNDSFQLLGATTGLDSVVASVDIENGGGDDANVIADTVIMNGAGVVPALSVRNTAAGTSRLTIQDSRVLGNVRVDNTGGVALPGDSSTTILNTRIEGTLRIDNAFGDDITQIDNAAIGVFPPPVPAAPVVIIVNGDGGSRTSFLGGTTIYGRLNVANGGNVLGTLQSLDIVTFNSTNVLGAVDINNGMGNSRVIVDNNSNLGSDPLAGGPVDVDNGDGYDDFQMTGNSTAQYGVDIDNTGPAAGGTQFWGSQTVIDDARIGTHPLVVGGLALLGDAGIDVVTISDTVVSGAVSLQLFAGNDRVEVLTNPNSTRTTFGAFFVEADDAIGPFGDDTVIVRSATIQVNFVVMLYGGDDALELRGNATLNGPTAAIIIDGGAGPLDRYLREASVIAPGLLPPGFEL